MQTHQNCCVGCITNNAAVPVPIIRGDTSSLIPAPYTRRRWVYQLHAPTALNPSTEQHLAPSNINTTEFKHNMFIACKNYRHKFAKCFSPYKCQPQVIKYKNTHKGRQYLNEISLFLKIQITLPLKRYGVLCSASSSVWMFNNIKIFTRSNINIISYNNISEFFHLFIYCDKVRSKHAKFWFIMRRSLVCVDKTLKYIMFYTRVFHIKYACRLQN
jgi:hypothetical protein